MVRLTEPLRFVGKIMSATIVGKGGKWDVSIAVDVEVDTDYWNEQDPVGIDLGIRQLMTLSDGLVAENQRAMNHALSRLRRLNKKLSRQVRFSNNWYKTVKKVQRAHERVANLRKDRIHKWTTYIASNYGVIGLEDLHVAGMMKNRKLARHIADAGLRMIRTQLEYKRYLYGSRLFVVDRWFASSKLCSRLGCGHKKAALSLSERVYRCDRCGHVIDRDLNAAINIRNKALQLAFD